MRSKGVSRCRRRAVGSDRGPSLGNFALDADRVVVARFVTPPARVAKTYEPAILIGPEMLLTSTRAVLFTTWATENCCLDGVLRCFELRQLKTARPPVFSGR